MLPDDCQFTERESGVSPVIGVILLTVIVVLLAAIMLTFVTAFDKNLHDPPPVSSFEQDYVATGEGNTDDRPYINISNQGGQGIEADKVVIKDDSGNTIRWSNVWTGNEYINATEYIHVDGFDSDAVLNPICQKGDSYSVIYQGEGAQTFVLAEWTAPRDPNLPPSSANDTNGDGIPDWC